MKLHARQPLDALGAKRFADQPAIFQDLDLLQVRLESSPRRFHREASIPSESSLLTTVLTVCHQPKYLSSEIFTSLKRELSYHNLHHYDVFSTNGGRLT